MISIVGSIPCWESPAENIQPQTKPLPRKLNSIPALRLNAIYYKQKYPRAGSCKYSPRAEKIIRRRLTLARSLHSQNSISPLKITEECLRNVFSHLDIGTDFLSLILALGGKPRDSEAGLGGWSMKTRPDGSYGIPEFRNANSIHDS